MNGWWTPSDLDIYTYAQKHNVSYEEARDYLIQEYQDYLADQDDPYQWELE